MMDTAERSMLNNEANRANVIVMRYTLSACAGSMLWFDLGVFPSCV